MSWRFRVEEEVWVLHSYAFHHTGPRFDRLMSSFVRLYSVVPLLTLNKSWPVEVVALEFLVDLLFSGGAWRLRFLFQASFLKVLKDFLVLFLIFRVVTYLLLDFQLVLGRKHR